jgi:acyl-CoA dehydrogenase
MLPAMAQAGMKVAAFSTGAYGRIREQFNLPLSRFEGIQEVAARIAGEAYKMDAARRLTLAAIDAGEKPAVVSGIMKYQATERLRRTINHAMDVHAGKAVIDGPKNYLASTYRAIPIAITVEGANIMTRSLMIYGQGSIRCHPFLQKEIEAANNPDQTQAVREFDELLGRHAGYVLKVLALAVGRAWTAGRLAAAPVDGPTAGYFRQLKRLSAALALISEAAIVTLGGALKRKEMISARLGDALSELYIVSAVLKQFEEADQPGDELALLEYACQTSLNAAEEALKGVIVNFPVRPVGWLLRVAVQPFGVVCRPSRDDLARKVSDIIAEPGAARDRLTSGIHVGAETELGRLDRAFRLMAELEPLKQKMRKARVRSAEEAEAAGVLTGNEAARMGEALALVREVLEVDRFAGEELIGKAAARQRPRAA